MGGPTASATATANALSARAKAARRAGVSLGWKFAMAKRKAWTAFAASKPFNASEEPKTKVKRCHE